MGLGALATGITVLLFSTPHCRIELGLPALPRLSSLERVECLMSLNIPTHPTTVFLLLTIL